MMDFNGNNRGFAFVKYCAQNDARRALKELNNYEIRKGRLLGVCKSVDNCRYVRREVIRHWWQKQHFTKMYTSFLI